MCGCRERKKGEDDLRAMAQREAKLEKRNYVIYKLENKLYYDAVECYQKNGFPGEVLEIISY